jgi:RNA polymerase sigma factor (sigma-70 family)
VLRFVQQFQDMVYAQSYRMLKNSMDAEEVCQDVLMKALRRMKEFEGKSKLSTWLYSITNHTCLDVLKKRKRQGPEVDIDEARLPAWTHIEGALSQIGTQGTMGTHRSSLGHSGRHRCIDHRLVLPAGIADKGDQDHHQHERWEH